MNLWPVLTVLEVTQSDGKSVQLVRAEVHLERSDFLQNSYFNGFYIFQKIFLDDKKINLRKKSEGLSYDENI